MALSRDVNFLDRLSAYQADFDNRYGNLNPVFQEEIEEEAIEQAAVDDEEAEPRVLPVAEHGANQQKN